ncbi:MAG: hypothetical protein HUJ74_03470 [Lachnospiraceae bacterium]|nr:hypothetical protein [Lachnospiraceae bacterium]
MLIEIKKLRKFSLKYENVKIFLAMEQIFKVQDQGLFVEPVYNRDEYFNGAG